MTYLLLFLALSPAYAATQCFSPSDCVAPAYCSSLKDGVVPGTCVGAGLKVKIHAEEKPAPTPTPTPPPPPVPKPFAQPAIRSSSRSSSSSSIAAPVARIDVPSDTERFWGFSEPIVDPAAIATPHTVSTEPAVVGSNVLLALLTALVFVLLAGPLGVALLGAPKTVKSFLGRLPLSIVVFVAGAMLLRWFVPAASAQGIAALLPNPTVLVPLYGVAFFLVAGVTNFVCNNMLTAEAGTLERFVLPAKAATGSWKRTAVAVAGSTALFAVVAAHVANGFSLLPLAQPGAAVLSLVAVVLATYSKDGLRYVLAKYRRWDPTFEANVLGIVLAALSVWLTRSLHLSPGYVFGVPMGLVIGAHLDPRKEGWFELSGLFAMLCCAFVAWMLLLAVPAGSVGQNFLTFLVVMLVEGAFFESLPHRYLAGGPVYRWNKWAWGVLCGVTTFLALHLLWNTSSTVATLGQSPPAITYVCVLAMYVVAVLALIAYCGWRRSRSAASGV